jgi:hypothetical protein
MRKLLELFQQQDGAYCALQLAIVGGFSIFWIAWAWVSIHNKAVVDCPAGLAGLLAAMLGAKVWKDYVDFKNQPPTP